MSNITLASNASGTATFTLASPATNTNRTITLPDADGTAIVGATPSASSANTVTNKIAIVIGGATYYLLASTSGA